MIRKAGYLEIANHWMLAVSFLMLAITGFGFLFHFSIGGGFGEMKRIHNWAGAIFIISLLCSMASYLHISLRFESNDLGWIKKAGGYFSRGKSVIPPQDKINAGQKIFYLMLLLVGLGITTSGYIMWRLPGIKSMLAASHLAHNLCFIFFVVSIPIHIYLSTIANPGTLRIMIEGTVPLEWAKKRHGKWVQDEGLNKAGPA